MTKSKNLKRIISLVVAVSISFSLIIYSSYGAKAFDTDYVNKDGMQLGYSIINGYSKLSIKNKQYNNKKIAVYCGLDVSNLYIMAVVGWFYVTNGIDLDRAMSDHDYAMEKIEALNSHLEGAGITNERAKQYKNLILKDAGKVYTSYDTVGLYIFDSTDERALELMKEDYVDFVLDGGKVPASMKDLNFDGKSDEKDAVLIQQYLADSLTFDDEDENEYALFVCDINGDKEADIRDVTALTKGDF